MPPPPTAPAAVLLETIEPVSEASSPLRRPPPSERAARLSAGESEATGIKIDQATAPSNPGEEFLKRFKTADEFGMTPEGDVDVEQVGTVSQRPIGEAGAVVRGCVVDRRTLHCGSVAAGSSRVDDSIRHESGRRERQASSFRPDAGADLRSRGAATRAVSLASARSARVSSMGSVEDWRGRVRPRRGDTVCRESNCWR